MQKPVGLQDHLEGTCVWPFSSSLFLRFDIGAECWKSRGKDTCTLGLKDMMWKLGRNEIASEQDEIILPDLGTMGYIISIRSPNIHADYLHDL